MRRVLGLKKTSLVWLLLGFIWGSTWLFIKLGLEDLPPFLFAGQRFFIAAAFLWAILGMRRVRLPKASRDWVVMVTTGLLTFSVDYGLIYWGENHIPAGLTSILFWTLPLFVLLLAHVFLPSERMTRWNLGGILVGLVGVTLIFSKQLQFSNPLVFWGSVAVLGAALAAAISSVLVRRFAQHLDPMILTTIQMTVGCIPLVALGLSLEGSPVHFHWTAMAWTSLLYMAVIGSALAFVLLYWLLKQVGPVRTGLIIPFTTVVAVLLGVIVLGEAFTWRTGVGGALVLVGLLVATRKTPPRNGASQPCAS